MTMGHLMTDMGGSRSLWVTPPPSKVARGCLRRQAEQARESKSFMASALVPASRFLPLVPVLSSLIMDWKVRAKSTPQTALGLVF